MKYLQIEASQVKLLNEFPWAYMLLAVALIAGYAIKYQAKTIKDLRAEHKEDVKILDGEVKAMSKASIETLAELGQYLKTKIGQDEKVTELLNVLKDKLGK